MQHGAAHDQDKHQPGVELLQIILPKDNKESTANALRRHRRRRRRRRRVTRVHKRLRHDKHPKI
jgi:hypothetical protein